MHSQSFSPKELYRFATQTERRNYGLKKEELIEAIDRELGSSLVDGTYRFRIKKIGNLFINARKKKSIDYLCQNLILRKLHNNIKTIYSVQQADRNAIVGQMKVLLNENVDMWAVRLDVRHFYESINRDKILNKITEDARLSYQTMELLLSLFNDTIVSSDTGIPRGLGVSAALSEMYMKYIDLSLRRVDGVYYYARFVDDIIMFCSSARSRDLVMDTATKELADLGLSLNMEKSYTWESMNPGRDLIYLGYSFRKKGKQLDVSIADAKIKVIKTRLTKSFVRYAKDHKFIDLKLRIKFLTGNFTLYQEGSLLPIKVGVFFNYKMVTNVDVLNELDRYYQSLLHCRTGKLGSRLSFTKAESKDLKKYSFRFGFEHHVNHHFTNEQVATITNCWL